MNRTGGKGKTRLHDRGIPCHGLGLLLAVPLLASVLFAAPDARPNIVFAIADDWGWPHASAYGDPVVKTPSFDRLAREGVLFQNAFVSSPSCTPSRNAILTGQYHWRLGSGGNLWSTLDTKHQTYPLLLEDQGYFVGSWRKSWGPGNAKNWERYPSGKVYKSPQEFLEAWPKDKPFCFWFGASDPHRPYKAGTGVESGIDPAKIRMWPHYPECPLVRSDVADYYFEVQRFDRELGEFLDTLDKLGLAENTLVMVTGDHGMPFPRGKANLYDSGTHVPLVARWPKVIKPGRKVEDFVSNSDLAPTFLEAAGLKPLEAMSGRSLMGIFRSAESGMIEPQARDHVLTGKERHVAAQEAPDSGGTPMRAFRNRDFLLIRNYHPERWPAGTPDFQKAFLPGSWLGDCDNGPTKTYMVENRDKDEEHRRKYELAFGKRPEFELYDLNKDPDQLVNVAGNPEYAPMVKQLTEQMETELRASGDPRVLGKGDETFDPVPYLGGGPKHPSQETAKEKE